ncbi:hypothetical protein LXL04_036912 [Taraxacum kok-saghyz]
MSTRRKKDVSVRTRSFADLPPEILSYIASRLPMIELLRFRGTCRDFRSASSTATAATDSYRRPWLLLHKPDTSECLLYNNEESKVYNRDIPDLKGAICLASHEGWLLLFKDESIFFFSPFSLAKITLPDFPHKQVNKHVAAFSDVPTSPDCIISVINRIDEFFVKVNVISKGQTSWTPYKIPCPDAPKDGSEPVQAMPYYYHDNVFQKGIVNEKTRQIFNLEEDEHVDVCGLSYGALKPHVYLNEVVFDSTTKTRVRRAVWIQPRFSKPDPNHRW